MIVRIRMVVCAAVCAVLLAAVPMALSGVATPAVPTAAAIDSWGLSFQQQGQPPIGNATAAELEPYDAFYIGDTHVSDTAPKTLYLTFDAGYENGYTASILDALKKHGVPATFFLVKNYIDTAPELVKRMVEEGHTIGNHTATHPDMSAIRDKAAFERELVGLSQAYESLIGKPMEKLYRPPQGKFSKQNLQMAKDLGYRTYFWSLAYVDWYVDNQPTREQAFSKLLTRVHPGAIVLLHSTSATNAEILDELLAKWKSMGYTFGRLQDL